MDSSSKASNGGGSQRLLALAQHLRLYKPPPFPEDIVEQSIQENAGKVKWPCLVGKQRRGIRMMGTQQQERQRREIGLDPELVNVVTVLEPFLSKHLLRVVPVIGILHDKKAFKPVLNPAEVDAVFDAPLEMMKSESRGERMDGREKYLIHFFDYDTDHKKYIIWGLTAGILIRAASVVYQRPPAFIEQNPKFKVPQVCNKG
ncbi:NUDIX hydrolase-like domain superfamily [Sesbania bispinosa]|nr:NUDIX hydrolase-like domain superfamily [Sesbania bispinosa]